MLTPGIVVCSRLQSLPNPGLVLSPYGGRLHNAKITAAAYYVPEHVVTNRDLERILDTSDEWIRTRTGIRERRFAGRTEPTSDLAAAAARKLLRLRGLHPADIDVIIFATVTPDMAFPSTACVLQEKIGARNAWGFDLSGACAGFVFALSTAAQFVQAGTYKRVLVIGADKMSSILDPKDRNTYVLFGDGAGAVLVEPAEAGEAGVIDFILRCDGSGGKYLYMPGGGSLHPASHDTVSRNMHVVHQHGRAVFKSAVQGMSEISEEILQRNNVPVTDVAFYIPHQANMRIIDAAVAKLQIDPCRVARNIERYANTTAATIPIGICEALEQSRIHKGDLLLLATFGAGFTAGSMLLRWSL